MAALHPVAVVLWLAGFFDGISDNWVHAAVLWPAAAAVTRDAVRTARGEPAPTARALLRRPEPGRPARRRSLLGTAGVGGYAAMAGTLGRYSWPATAAVVLPGAVVLLVGWWGSGYPRAVPPPVPRLGALAWGAVLVGGGLWELAALLQQPALRVSSASHPTISLLLDPLLASYPGRTAALAGWLAMGWFLLRAAPAGGPPGNRARESAGQRGGAAGGPPARPAGDTRGSGADR